MKHVFILYDSRARTVGTDGAAVLCTANTLKGIRRDRDHLFSGEDSVAFQYDMVDGAAVNEREVE